jgi:hypothetical protein
MSVNELEQDEDFDATLEEAEPVQGSGSLSGRMERRAQAIELQSTERFAIPGWEGILEVELKALGFTTIRKTQERNQRIREVAKRELYSLADQLLKATVGFWEVAEDGSGVTAINDDWTSLARRLPNCPDGVTPRQALLLLIGEKRIHFLVADWSEWARATQSESQEDLQRDFAPTG